MHREYLAAHLGAFPEDLGEHLLLLFERAVIARSGIEADLADVSALRRKLFPQCQLVCAILHELGMESKCGAHIPRSPRQFEVSGPGLRRGRDRRGTISVFEGPAPQVVICANKDAEVAEVAGFLRAALEAGMSPEELGVFVRSRDELPRARAAVIAAGQEPVELSERAIEVGARIAIGTMHLAKGLEFKAVAVMACDDEVLPSAARIDAVIEESDLDEVYETERHLLYVACTRARDRLLVSGVKPASEFLADMKQNAATRT